MWAWIQWLLGLFLSGNRDQQIGALKQQAADQAETLKEEKDAATISDEVDRESPEQVAADLARELQRSSDSDGFVRPGPAGAGRSGNADADNSKG